MDKKQDGGPRENKERKVPPGEWPAIAARHDGGESLSSIARSYGCSPPAIRYIIRRHAEATKPGADADSLPRVIGPELRDRVISDIAAFVVALDAAMVTNTRPALLALRDATSRLLRAASRAHIEVESAIASTRPASISDAEEDAPPKR